jgi:hypothetical protein
MAELYFENKATETTARRRIMEWDRFQCTSECFHNYATICSNLEQKSYFGFFTHPKITKLIEEFNSLFDNIQIKVILQKEFKYNDVRVERNVREGKSYPATFFFFKFNDGFSPESCWALSMILAQFIRISCPDYDFWNDFIKIEKDFVKASLEIFNRKSNKYGSWAGTTDWYLNIFKKLDDYDLINKFSEELDLDDMPCGSDLYKFLTQKGA